MNPLSVVIITLNEERNIARCLDSLLPVADEIVVVDSYSTDSTKAICSKYNVRFTEQEFLGFNAQKNLALSLASHPLVLSLDADEVLSEELTRSILEVKEHAGADGWTMNRRTNYCGKWINHCWYPDAKLRLWDARKGKWDGNVIHEKVDMEPGSVVKHLRGDLLHYSYHTLDDHLLQMRRFTAISAEAMYAAGVRAGAWKLIVKPAAIFIKMYFIKQGFRDGYEGFLIARFSAFGEMIKYSRLRYLLRNGTPKTS